MRGTGFQKNGLRSYEKNWYIGIDVSKKWLDVAIFVENSDLKGIRKKQSLAERERHGEGEYVAYEKEQALQEGERSL